MTFYPLLNEVDLQIDVLKAKDIKSHGDIKSSYLIWFLIRKFIQAPVWRCNAFVSEIAFHKKERKLLLPELAFDDFSQLNNRIIHEWLASIVISESCFSKKLFWSFHISLEETIGIWKDFSRSCLPHFLHVQRSKRPCFRLLVQQFVVHFYYTILESHYDINIYLLQQLLL